MFTYKCIIYNPLPSLLCIDIWFLFISFPLIEKAYNFCVQRLRGQRNAQTSGEP